ncbi:MAG: NAD(P)H-dependent oxidoreductase subunit E [Nitrosomonadales bacterium]|nr:NAD(P)H-dependent oxidoreductase subunit E [Nitrosomonadales bacterium]
MTESPHASTLSAILAHHPATPQALLQILNGIQSHYGHLPATALDALASHLQMPRSQVDAVAAFYAFLDLEPRGEYHLLFADNIIEQMQGSTALLDQLCRELWIEPGKVSEDGLVSVGLTSCIGMGDQGPALLVNQRPLTRLTALRIAEIACRIRDRVPLESWPQEWFAVTDTIQRRDWLLSAPPQPGQALVAVLARDADASLAELRRSGLRGRGGAGYPTADKWAYCRAATGAAHYVVCNADEGEPGTFKDRFLLSHHADLVFEGMTACARLIGAHQGFLYLRGEYRYLSGYLQDVLERRRKQGWLGRNILGCAGFDFDIEIHLGAGAYVCGEESALLESLEGRRGIPRIRPPFPVQRGYLGQPTVINNVETFALACKIMQEGGAAFAACGTAESRGTRLHSVSGDCARPGIYEYPYGVTIAEVLRDCGADDAQAVQVGGPSGVCVAAVEFDRRLAFEDVPTAGAFMVFDHSRDLFEVARNFSHFFAHESCGFCTPCRVGTSLLRDLMDKLHQGLGSATDLAQIEQLDAVLRDTSHCGLGHSACNPVLDTLAKFRPAYQARLAHHDFAPAFDLDAALNAARQLTGRDDAAAHLEQQP